jgi:Na+-driven multidrug efflux pump
MKGLGKQKHATYMFLFSYYAIALPLGGFFAYYLDYGLDGLWIGVFFG